MAAAETVEDIYALSPLQRGMLFHRLYSEGSRTYFVQARLRIDGLLDRERFRTAWQQLIDRHPALRTFFVWQGVEEPLQVVQPRGTVTLRWEYRDWRNASEPKLAERLEEFFERDHARGLDLGKAPLFRITLLRLPEWHLCVFSHEHLILDGWCLPLLISELLELYESGRSGRPPDLAPAVPYKRLIAWLAAQPQAAAERHWKQRLRGFGEPTPLPLRRTSAPNHLPAAKAGFAEALLVLDQTQTERLQTFARASGLTLNTLVQGAWAQLLARHAAQDEVVFGVTVSGRAAELEDAELVVGPCLNTLPLRIRSEPWRRLVPWLRSLQQQNLELRQFGHVGLSELQHCRAPGTRGEQPAPLFESIVVFENYPSRALVSKGPQPLRVCPLQLPLDSAARLRSAERNNYPLTLVAAPGPRLELMLAHAKSEIELQDAGRLLVELTTILNAFAEVPRGLPGPALGALPSLAGAPSGRVSPVPRPSRQAASIVRRFTGNVTKRPDATALVSGEVSLSYSELERRSSAVAQRLLGHFAARASAERRIAICTRGWQGVAALLGALRAGASYVPIDRDWPAARRSWVLEDSQASAVLVDEPSRSLVDGHGCIEVMVLGGVAEEGLQQPAGPAPLPATCEPTGEEIAYVIYTSGSSGRPKGVAVSHAALLHYVEAVGETLGFQPGLSFGLMSSFASDLGHTATFGSLGFGGTLHVLAPEVALDGGAFGAYQREHALDVLKLTASQLQILLDAPEPGTVLPRRHLILGGEALTSELVDKLDVLVSEHAPGCRVSNHYGPTEATIGALLEPVLPRSESERGISLAPAIGRPLPRMYATVADRHGRTLPEGAAGELYLGGPGLALGYLDRPALTAERFVPDPAGTYPGTRLYRTGDRVRRRRDGRMEFLGRTDRQLKLRGHRIEPCEIETLLRRAPELRDAAVKAVLIDGEAQLVAYCLAKGTLRASESTLRARLAERLPDAMVPAHFVQLDTWPLTHNGKLDYGALPSPRLQAASFTAPRGETEAVLAELWAAVLGREDIGVHASFFELGGDSIQSLQIVARARRRGLCFTPKDVFEARTIARLAERIEASQAVGSGAAQARLSGDGAELDGSRAFALTPIQQRFFEARHPNPNRWNQALILRVAGRLQPKTVVRAVQQLYRRHPALRLRFEHDCELGWKQRAASASEPVAVQLVDLSHLPEVEQGTAIESFSERAQHSLDLERGPLFGAVWFDCGTGRAARLLLFAHHLAVDVVSWQVLLSELGALCSGQNLPDAATSYLRWAAALAQAAAAPELLEQLPYWLRATGQELPRDGEPAGGFTCDRAVGLQRTLPASLTRALWQRAPAAYRVEVDDILLAAVAVSLGKSWGLSQVVIECEAHGRGHPRLALDLSSSVGWFTSRYPLRLDLAGELDPEHVLASVHAQRRALPHQGIGYGLLRYLRSADSEPLRRLRALPAPQIGFNNLGRIGLGVEPQGLFARAAESVRGMRDPQSLRSQPLELTVRVEDDGLRLDWIYDPELHRQQTIEQLAGACELALRKLLQRLAAPCDRPTAKLDAEALVLSGLTQSQLDSLALAAHEVEDLYRCSPMQEGLLAHSLTRPSDYINQLSLRVQGLGPRALEHAWQALMDRHPILRTGFVWRLARSAERASELPWPVQVVYRHVPVQVERRDLSHLDPAEQEQSWSRLLEQDREAGYDLTRAPLWRVLVAECGADRQRILWSRHHVLLDGWCSSRLLAEWLELYESHRRGRPVRPGTVAPYRDYIAWLAKQDHEAARAFWDSSLAQFEHPTALPFQDADPAFGSPRRSGAATEQVVLEVGRGQCAELRRWAGTHQLTLGSVCQGAWALLLARMSGERTVTFGVTVSGRPATLAGVEHMLGLFINSLPMRVSCPPEQTVCQWLAELQAHNSELREYEYSSLASIQERVQQRERANGNGNAGEALFDSLFVFENYPVDAALTQARAGLQLLGVSRRDPSHYGLTLVVLPGAELRLELQYDSARYTGKRAARVLELYRALLLDLPRLHDNARLGTVQLATGGKQAARQQLARHAVQPGLLEQFAQQVRRSPDQTAVRCGQRELSYGELDVSASRVAQALVARGVGAEVRIGLCLERSLESVIGLLGILKAGACYMPLEPGLPEARQRILLADAQVEWVLGEVDAGLRASVGALALDELLAEPPHSTQPPPLERNPQGLAYVIYTSGSTGRPKGVGISDAQVLRLFEATRGLFRFGEHDVWTLFHSHAFDFSVWELWGALLYGGTLEVVPYEVSRDPAALYKLLVERGVTVLSQTPSAFHALCAHVSSLEQPEAGLKLGTVVLGGEALDVRRLEPWFEVFGRAGPRLFNMYGITETTVHVTCAEITPRLAAADGPNWIGKPLADLEVYVLDPLGNPLPEGVAGELCIGGAGVGRGYVGHSGLTAERFVPNRFGAPGARLYRSGDLGRIRSDGSLEYLGRIDSQVKLRGYRIEPGEIASVLRAHPQVRDAVVLLDAGEGSSRCPDDARLVACLVADADELAVEGVRAFLREQLPQYMLPSQCLVLQALPLTFNGKLDTRVLFERARQERATSGTSPARVAPRNETERVLAALWADVLEVSDVGVFDDFFALGGHSLSAMRIAARIRTELGLDLPPRHLFEASTVATLASVVAELRARNDTEHAGSGAGAGP
ncbi:MAG: amino acid adenylation domain-containing protein [Proteobacteria bacterium]|nr:amino acid adenylation domain-containing protein [Pseudomonadota bacterium]